MPPRRDSTGFLVRDAAAAGLPGRDAATTGQAMLLLQSSRQVWPQEDHQVLQARHPRTLCPQQALLPPLAAGAATLLSSSLVCDHAYIGLFWSGPGACRRAPRSDLSPSISLCKYNGKWSILCFVASPLHRLIVSTGGGVYHFALAAPSSYRFN